MTIDAGRRPVGAFVTEVRPRWSDMDVYGHVNHASAVTLLEEARTDMLAGAVPLRDEGPPTLGMVVARLVVDYKAPLFADGGSLRVDIDVRDLDTATFSLHYVVRSGSRASDPVAVTAETLMAAYDLSRKSLRRLTDTERSFLAQWSAGGEHAAV